MLCFAYECLIKRCPSEDITLDQDITVMEVEISAPS